MKLSDLGLMTPDAIPRENYPNQSPRWTLLA
jgi:hypothetical protein